MYYVCKFKKGQVSILDTEDGAVDIFPESQARKVASILNVPIIGLGKGKVKAFKPQNGRFNDEVCDFVVYKLMYYIVGAKLDDLDCDFDEDFNFYGIEDYLYNDIEITIKIDPVYICNANVAFHLSNTSLVDTKYLGGLTINYQEDEISGVVNINEGLRNRGCITRFANLFKYLRSDLDTFKLED